MYSWKLVPTDKVPKGKKDDLSLREKERNIQRDLNDGIDIASAQMTTTQLLERYFATKKSLQNSTYENYQNLFKKHIKDTVVGQTSIGKVHKSDIILLYDDIHENGNIAISTLKIIQSFMYPAFQLAVEDNIIRVNPCMGCMHHFIDNAESERIALTKEQEEGLLHYVKKSRYYNYLYPMFVFMLETGCRIGDDDDKIRLNQRKPSKYKGLRRFGPEKNLQRINKFMKERPIFYKNLIQMKENIRFYLRCFYCITKVMILQFNSENRTELARNG